jgi:endonuclease/exonuclease/phosphatase family metal-dependent hydrolase
MYVKSRRDWRGALTLGAVVLVFGLHASAAGADSLDNFKCYKVKDLKAPKFEKTVLASLADQFGIEADVQVKKPFLLCNPTSKDGEGIQNAADHLVCYKVKPSKLEPRPHVEVVNQLGTLQLEVSKSFVVCLPSTKTVLPSPSSGEFLALSYNVAGLPEGISGSHPATNTPIIAPLLNNYDLVLMQETWKTPDPNPLAPTRVYHEILEAGSMHPFKSVSAPLPLGSDPERPTALVSDGLNRFARFRFDDVARERWTNCHDSAADCLSLKGFSFARTTLPGGTVVDVYNLHMEAGGDPEDDALRDAAVTQLSTFINTHSVGRALIVGGDFNLHTDSEPDSTQFQRLLSETGLVDVCASLSCPQPGRIDKFLFRSSPSVTLTPTSWHFETDVFVDGMDEPLSDHDALAVNFEWENSGE